MVDILACNNVSLAEPACQSGRHGTSTGRTQIGILDGNRKSPRLPIPCSMSGHPADPLVQRSSLPALHHPSPPTNMWVTWSLTGRRRCVGTDESRRKQLTEQDECLQCASAGSHVRPYRQGFFLAVWSAFLRFRHAAWHVRGTPGSAHRRGLGDRQITGAGGAHLRAVRHTCQMF